MDEPEEVNSFQVKVESNPVSEVRIPELSLPEPASRKDIKPEDIALYAIPSQRQTDNAPLKTLIKNPHKTFNPTSSKHLSETRRWTEKHADIVGNTSSGQHPRTKCYTTGKIDFKHNKKRFRENAGGAHISKLVPTPENAQHVQNTQNVPASLLNRRNCNLPSLPNFYDDVVTDRCNPSDFRVRSASLEHGQLKHARNHHPISKEQLRYQQQHNLRNGSPGTSFNEESNLSNGIQCHSVLTQDSITQRRRIQNFIQSVPETIKSKVKSVKIEEKPHWTLCHEFSVKSKTGNDRDVGLKAVDYPHVPFSLLETGINTVSNQRKMQPKSCQDKIREIIRDPHSACNQDYYWDWVNKLDADEYIQTCPGLNQGAFLVRPDGQSHSKGFVLVVKFKPGVNNEKRKLPIFHDLDTNKLSIPLEPLEELTFDYLEGVIAYLRDNFIDLFTGVSYRETVNTENCLMLTKQEVTRWNFNKHGENEKYGYRKTDEYENQFTPETGYKLEFDKNELFAQYINTSKRKRILEEEEYDLQGELELKRGQFVTANRERLKSLSLLEMYTTHLELCNTEHSRQWMEFEKERAKDWDRPRSIELKGGSGAQAVKVLKNKSLVSLGNSNSSRIGSLKSLSSGSTLTNAEGTENRVISKQVSPKQGVSSSETMPKTVNFEEKELKQQIKRNRKPDAKQSLSPKSKPNSDENSKNSMISGLFKNISSKSKSHSSTKQPSTKNSSTKNSSTKNSSTKKHPAESETPQVLAYINSKIAKTNSKISKKSDLKQEILQKPNNLLKNDESEIFLNASTNSTNPDQIRVLSENHTPSSLRYPRRRTQGGTMSTTTSQSGMSNNFNMMESSQKLQLPKDRGDHFIPGSTMYRTRERLNQRIEHVSEHYKQTRERYFQCDQEKDDVEIRLTEIRRELSVINEQYLAACWILQYKYSAF